ncbi:hypothetical protein K503DRAFT_766828 [Rhizopogon vinicolor AM-OR11-026]|uniref:Uncharacterized protein n=1 Tax=Rhizopogon vinicolor AM-OR11-026 TaxID=1314800 RepID=A0A1B7NC46_9AGAM|nr:hypothetical protein K503DRAFT_766828 [Rhizopogon vinicolor AM-OR11-026]
MASGLARLFAHVVVLSCIRIINIVSILFYWTRLSSMVIDLFKCTQRFAYTPRDVYGNIFFVDHATCSL